MSPAPATTATAAPRAAQREQVMFMAVVPLREKCRLRNRGDARSSAPTAPTLNPLGARGWVGRREPQPPVGPGGFGSLPSPSGVVGRLAEIEVALTSHTLRHSSTSHLVSAQRCPRLRSTAQRRSRRPRCRQPRSAPGDHDQPTETYPGPGDVLALAREVPRHRLSPRRRSPTDHARPCRVQRSSGA